MTLREAINYLQNTPWKIVIDDTASPITPEEFYITTYETDLVLDLCDVNVEL